MFNANGSLINVTDLSNLEAEENMFLSAFLAFISKNILCQIFQSPIESCMECGIIVIILK